MSVANEAEAEQVEQKMASWREQHARARARLDELRGERIELIRAGRQAGLSVSRMARLLDYAERNVQYTLAGRFD